MIIFCKTPHHRARLLPAVLGWEVQDGVHHARWLQLFLVPGDGDRLAEGGALLPGEPLEQQRPAARRRGRRRRVYVGHRLGVGVKGEEDYGGKTRGSENQNMSGIRNSNKCPVSIITNQNLVLMSEFRKLRFHGLYCHFE